MSAESIQRQKIINFCRQAGIQEPDFSSPADLTRCIKEALEGLNPSALIAQRDELRLRLSASLGEGEKLESQIRESNDNYVDALKVLSKVEQIADRALERSNNSR